MPHRYSLRVENGALEGQSFPIGREGFSVGRKAGSSLHLNDGSVSGAHAQLSLDDQGISVRDLGSTNGTRIGSAKILEARLDIGQRVTFGAIHCTLVQGEPETTGANSGARTTDEIVLEGDSVSDVELALEEPAPPVPGRAPQASRAPAAAPAPPPPRSAPAPIPSAMADGHPQEVEQHTVSAENLARSQKKSPVGALVLVVLALGSAAAWWFFGRAGEQASGGRPVTPLPGNLLAEGYSFEGPEVWQALDEGQAAFNNATRAAYSGKSGLAVSLAAGEKAVHASPWVDVRNSQRLVLSARVRVSGAADLRLGIELAPSGSATGSISVSAFGDPLAESTAFAEQSFELTVPQGYSQARVVLVARVAGDSAEATGRVSVDDAGLSVDGTGEVRAVLDEYRFFDVGPLLNLFKVDATLLSGLHVRPQGSDSRAALELHPTAVGNGVRLNTGASGPLVLGLTAEPRAVDGGLATMGQGGYAQRQEDFEATGVTDLVMGRGVNLLRLALGQPCKVRGQSQGGAYRLSIELPAGAQPLIQVRFQDERTAAINLAGDADRAEQSGRLGECLGLWQRLLDQYPFEQHIVQRAESQRANLLRAGFEELRDLEGQIERASFFRLAGLYRQCREQSNVIAQRYSGSEVEDSAQALVERVDQDLLALETDLDRREVQRLQSILDTLDGQEAKGLAARMRTYLKDEFNVTHDDGGGQ